MLDAIDVGQKQITYTLSSDCLADWQYIHCRCGTEAVKTKGSIKTWVPRCEFIL